jgi:hypothetical protein
MMLNRIIGLAAVLMLINKDRISANIPISQPLVEIERIPAQRTSARVAGLEPLEETSRVEQVLAGGCDEWSAHTVGRMMDSNLRQRLVGNCLRESMI